jgi:hypothetical protein
MLIIVFLPASTRSVPQGLQFALLLLLAWSLNFARILHFEFSAFDQSCRQRLWKTVLKRQGSLAKTRPEENCLGELQLQFSIIMNKCSHVAWNSDI